MDSRARFERAPPAEPIPSVCCHAAARKTDSLSAAKSLVTISLAHPAHLAFARFRACALPATTADTLLCIQPPCFLPLSSRSVFEEVTIECLRLQSCCRVHLLSVVLAHAVLIVTTPPRSQRRRGSLLASRRAAMALRARSTFAAVVAMLLALITAAMAIPVSRSMGSSAFLAAIMIVRLLS